MKREQLLKHWEVIEAYKNGADVECYETDFKSWFTDDSPLFLIEVQYRIKKQPELIPFDFSDAERLIGKAVKAKVSGHLFLIAYAEETELLLCGRYDHVRYETLFGHFTFLDGSPCGKQKE